MVKSSTKNLEPKLCSLKSWSFTNFATILHDLEIYRDNTGYLGLIRWKLGNMRTKLHFRQFSCIYYVFGQWRPTCVFFENFNGNTRKIFILWKTLNHFQDCKYRSHYNFWKTNVHWKKNGDYWMWTNPQSSEGNSLT